MLKILFSPKRAERHPIEMMFVGIFYSSLAILLSAWIFPDYASLVMVFFSVISCLYVVQGAIKLEESKERDYKSEEWLLKQHSRTLLFFLFLFIGFVISFTAWTLFLPNDKVMVLFNLQSSVVEGIQSMVATGNSVTNGTFYVILLNNLKVMAISLIFALFFGAGAIFVLVWNASVMGFVIGEVVKNKLGIAALPLAFTKYFLHGIPEMMGYLTVALAGGILYVAVFKGDFFKTGRTKRILLDTFLLLIISILFLIAAAFIETYISPYI